MLRRTIASCTTLTLIGVATWAWARHHDEFEPPGPFAIHWPFADRPIGKATPAAATPAWLASSRIAAVGNGALVIDADSGSLVLTDQTGASTSQLAIGHDAGMLAYDPIARIAYVADRRGDRVVVVDVGRTLTMKTSWKTTAEPYGLALTPDRTTVLVTTIADRRLVAYDTTGQVQWSTKLGPEPRAIAVSPDGARALVTYLASGMVDQIALAAHTTRHLGITPSFNRGFARGGWATAFMGNDLAIVPFQTSRPSPENGEGEGDGENTGSYGGSFFPPISHHLAFLDVGSGRQVTAQIAAQQPRALAWDGARDALYVAGMGTDSLLQVNHASQVDVAKGFTAKLGGKQACGPDGVAIAPDGDVLVWCAFSRSVARIDAVDPIAKRPTVAHGPVLATSTLDVVQHEGMVLFHTSSIHVSDFGQLACANCHFEGRADGLSWQINGHPLQTPLLTGRLRGTEPFKWDGTAKDLKTSMRATIGRLGGDGLGKPHIDALAAYLEAMPAVRAPTAPRATIARGKLLFESAGCSNCHDGAMYTDQSRHKLRGTLTAADTPSLIGLAASAPYFHDGSAATLEAVLRERGAVHGMSDTAKVLSDPEVVDLTAFLESL